MNLITDTLDLAAVCARMAQHTFVTVDTEFLRETTYYPLLASPKWRRWTKPSSSIRCPQA